MIGLNFSPKIDQQKALNVVEEIKTDPMGGWVELPLNFSVEELTKIQEIAEKINQNSEVLVCIGIGGSYLGHRAIIEALRPKSKMQVIYAGNSLSRREQDYIWEQIGERDFSINVISKSGTTLEPARAFEFFKEKLAERYGVAEAAKRVYATTDAEKGLLHDEAVRDGYTRLVVPDNVGGRYSVLTPVGLLPMAVSGVDIEMLIKGAKDGAEEISEWLDEAKNVSKDEELEEFDEDAKEPVKIDAPSAIRYGFMRYMLGSKGYDTEVFATFEPCTMYFNEWIKQLFGESEGKNRQGVFPASVVYSTDLHSLGQFMQDGRRDLWETIINYPTDEVNAKVVKAVLTAHVNGRIPVLKLDVASFDEKGFGELIYFFEMACAVSAKLFGVNPFDQPGVEAYKNELHKLMEEK